MENNVQKAIFFGYKATSSQINYWDMDIKLVNNYKHVRFDELINDLEIPNTNSRKLGISLVSTLPDEQ